VFRSRHVDLPLSSLSPASSPPCPAVAVAEERDALLAAPRRRESNFCPAADANSREPRARPLSSPSPSLPPYPRYGGMNRAGGRAGVTKTRRLSATVDRLPRATSRDGGLPRADARKDGFRTTGNDEGQKC